MKKLIIGTLVTAGLGLGFATPAQAAPRCVINSTNADVAGDNSICGVPNVKASINDSLTNLKNNLNVVNGPNMNLGNLAHAITHGVGTDG